MKGEAEGGGFEIGVVGDLPPKKWTQTKGE